MFAKGPGSEIAQLRAELQGRWRQPARAVMVLLSLRGLTPAQIAELLDCHPATVRRWISRFNAEGMTGLAEAAFGCGRSRNCISADTREHGQLAPGEGGCILCHPLQQQFPWVWSFSHGLPLLSLA